MEKDNKTFVEEIGFDNFKRYELMLLKKNIRVCPACGKEHIIDETTITKLQIEVIQSNDLVKVEELRVLMSTGLCNTKCIERYLK